MLCVLRVAYLLVELAQNNMHWVWCLVPYYYSEIEVTGAFCLAGEMGPLPNLLDNQVPWSGEVFLLAL